MLYIWGTGSQGTGNTAPEPQQAGSPNNTAFIPQKESEAHFTNPGPELSVKKGDMCFNHPWRQAYARCSFCKRPFCYADLVGHSGMQYCLEDINHMEHSVQKATISANRFTYVSSVLFLAGSLLLFYYTYPQFLLMLTQVQLSGLSIFIYNISYINFIVIMSSAFVILGIVSSISILAPSRGRFFLSALMLLAMLLFFPYEYLSSSSTYYGNYLLYVTIIVFVNMITLVMSRFGYEGRISEKKLMDQVEWPRIETF